MRALVRPLQFHFRLLLVSLGLLAVLFLAAACGDGDDASDVDQGAVPGGTEETSGRRGTTPPPQERLVRDDSPVLGPTEAPVTLVEFLDPECESCRAAYPAVKELLAEYQDDLRLVVRYFPLHGNSELAARATEAAGAQGKYWEMQELLFERQPDWGEKQSSQEDLFIEYADELGLDIDRFTADMDSSEYAEKVKRDQADGVALGVRGTPTFFVNGEWVQQPSYDVLKAAVDQALE